ncbi:MAG: presenilin family intramembrane aspartyl protease [Candidatus Diapherotrites archaeon]|nr:presenilin family intramembrane aspartyl protease [Candidatus Diapherotrites archaeon]
MDRSLLLQLAAIFIITQMLGLFVGASLVQAISAGELEQPTIATDNPDDPLNSIALFLYLLFFTGMLLLFMRFFKGRHLFKWMEAIVVFSASLIVFSAFLPGLSLMFAIFLTALRLALPEEVLLRNITAIIAIAGVGALLGVSLGVIPIVILLLLLACYDFIAVFKTKHMVKLAKEITGRNLAFTVAMPTPSHQFELGTGDLVMPLLFAVSAMKAGSALGSPAFLILPGLILAASLAGLILTLEYLEKHVGKALPALPPQVALMIAAWLAGKAIGL